MKWDQFCNSLTPTRNGFEQTHPTTCFKCHSLSLGIPSWNNYLWSDAPPAPDQLCFDLHIAPMNLEEAQLPSLPKMQRNSSLGKVQLPDLTHAWDGTRCLLEPWPPSSPWLPPTCQTPEAPVKVRNEMQKHNDWKDQVSAASLFDGNWDKTGPQHTDLSEDRGCSRNKAKA